MTRKQLPAEWVKLAEQAGITGSYRGIAQAADVAPSTLTRLVQEGRTSPETTSRVADALRIPEAKVYELAELAAHDDLGPWSPPVEANQLDGAEREAIERLIRVMAKGEDHAERQPQEQKMGDPDDGDAEADGAARRRPRGAVVAQGITEHDRRHRRVR